MINVNNYEAYLLDYLEGYLKEDQIAELRAFSILHPELNIELDHNDLPYVLNEDEVADFKGNLFRSELDLPDEKLISYVEGNLSDKEKNKFESELNQDAQLQKDLNLYKNTVLSADKSETFSEKKNLIRNEEAYILNNRLILYVEGLLNKSEVEEFNFELKNDALLAKELDLYKNTVISADINITYPNKEALKKENKVIFFTSFRTVYAMAAAILLLIGLFVVYQIMVPDINTPNEMADHSTNKINKVNTDIKSSELNKNPGQVQLNNNQTSMELAAKKSKYSKSNYFVNDTIESTDQKSVVTPTVSEENLVAENKVKEQIKDSDTLSIANTVKSEQVIVNENKSHQVLLAVAETDEEEFEVQSESKRGGWWKRAVKVAQQVNGLGLKAVNGDEKANDNYMLSFNSFSIEKK